MDFAPGSSSICIDMGASACISNNKNDFVSLVACNNNTIQGIGADLKITGTGNLQWSNLMDAGQEFNLYVCNALFVPGAPMNLLCAHQIPMMAALLKPITALVFSTFSRLFTIAPKMAYLFFTPLLIAVPAH
jgi:hypothetical protein